MHPEKMKSLLWTGGAVLAAGMGVFFLVQFVLSYHSAAGRAVEDGKRVIVSVGSGEVTIRAEEKPETAEPQKASENAPETAPKAPEVSGTPPATDGAAEKPQADKETYGPASPSKEPAAAARPAPKEAVVYDGRARLAVVINGLGLNHGVTEDVAKLPAGVTLAFSPYVSNLDSWVSAAGKSGHEVLIDLPMETLDYPQFDPGPLAILNDADKAKNIHHLKAALSAAKDYAGVVAPVDETITKSLTTILPLIDELQKQNMPFIYNEKPSNAFLQQEARAIGLPVVAHYIVIDEVLSADAIDARLEEARRMVIDEQRTVLVLGRPYPLTVKRVEAWLQSLKEKNGLEPSPVSTIINS